ncbi:MAG: hypothetical protein HFH42_02525 [Lachnospiraceae bacterium]|nr:hypothetical protein [Lachnospiraceae bacterium]
MKKLFLAVCDMEAAYAKKLGEWISLEKSGWFSVHIFFSPQNFLEFQNTGNLDVALLGSGFWEDAQIMGQVLHGARKGTGQKEVLWMFLKGSEESGKVPDAACMFPVIEKYQPASGIVREIFSYCQKYREKGQEGMPIRREVTGIYSPCHSAVQTPFALTLAQVLSQEEKVLYVNFNECAGFAEWLQESYSHDLLDVMYLCLAEEGKASESIGSAAHRLEGFDYIPPAEDGVCLGEISRDDYKRFLTLLIEKSGYDVVILDFGMMAPGFLELLELCSKVYILAEPSNWQGYALRHFRRMIARQGNQPLEEKMSYLSLPSVAAGNCQGGQKMQQWIWGELGDYARELVGVQSGTD